MGTEIHDASETDEGQPVMYEELAALEQEFDDVDVEIRECKPYTQSIHSLLCARLSIALPRLSRHRFAQHA